MKIFLDPRAWTLLLVPVFLLIFFALRKHLRHSESHYADFKIGEGLIAIALTLVVLLGLHAWGVNARIDGHGEQVGGFIVQKWYEDGDHQVRVCTGSGDNESCSYHTEYHRRYSTKANIGDWYGGNTSSERRDTPTRGAEPYRGAPQWWTDSYVGSPVSFANSYPNYIAARFLDDFTLSYESLSSVIPDICPAGHTTRINRTTTDKIMTVGFPDNHLLTDTVAGWEISPTFVDLEKLLDETLTFEDVPLYGDTMFGYLGGEVQGDAYIYIFDSQNSLYADMCMAKWLNGSKNGIYVFIFGSSDDGVTYAVSDVQVRLGVDGVKDNTGFEYESEGARDNYKLKFNMRNELLNYFVDGGSFTREGVLGIVYENVNSLFKRQEMAEFNGYIDFVYPTDKWMIWTWVFIVIMNIFTFIWAEGRESL